MVEESIVTTAVASMKLRKMRRDFAFRVFLSEFGPKEPVEATRHERELEVTVNFHRDR